MRHDLCLLVCSIWSHLAGPHSTLPAKWHRSHPKASNTYHSYFLFLRFPYLKGSSEKSGLFRPGCRKGGKGPNFLGPDRKQMWEFWIKTHWGGGSTQKMKTLLVLKRVSRQKYPAIWVGLVDQVCGYTPRLRAAISNVHHNSSAGNQKMQSSLHSLKIY